MLTASSRRAHLLLRLAIVLQAAAEIHRKVEMETAAEIDQAAMEEGIDQAAAETAVLLLRAARMAARLRAAEREVLNEAVLLQKA